MRVVTWNCNMCFRKKHSRLVKFFDPDVMAIQECEDPDRVGYPVDGFSKFSWSGSNKNKGICIFINDRLMVKDFEVVQIAVQHAVLVRTDKKTILSFWTHNHKTDMSKSYIGQAYSGICDSISFLDNTSIVLGDFNWNPIFERNKNGQLYGKMADTVSLLRGVGLASAYHATSGEVHGGETAKTFYLHKCIDKGYHIDYIFIDIERLAGGCHLYVGKPEEWLFLSDHMPLCLECW